VDTLLHRMRSEHREKGGGCQALILAINPCSLDSNKDELMGISGV
jgi:hypothetical protein